MQPEQRPVDRLVDWHTQLLHNSCSVDRWKERSTERSTDWHKPCFCWGSVDRSVDQRKVDRPSDRPTDRSAGSIRIWTPFV